MQLANLRNCLKDKTAASFAEYALVLAIIGAAIAIAAYTLSNTIAGKIGHITSSNANYNVTGATNPTGNAHLQSGEAAFIKPDEMRVGKWYPLEFVAGPDLKAIVEESEGLPLTRPHRIFVSHRMSVTLLPDPNFEIQPKSKTIQETGSDLTQTWQWDLKPLAQGNHTLIAQVDVFQRAPNGRYLIFNRYSRRVSVRVGVGTIQQVLQDIRGAQSIGDALTSLLESWRAMLIALALVIGAIIGVVIAWHKLQRHFPRRKQSGGDTGGHPDRQFPQG
jgi:pilus assembly protein Flp/PilA